MYGADSSPVGARIGSATGKSVPVLVSTRMIPPLFPSFSARW